VAIQEVAQSSSNKNFRCAIRHFIESSFYRFMTAPWPFLSNVNYIVINQKNKSRSFECETKDHGIVKKPIVDCYNSKLDSSYKFKTWYSEYGVPTSSLF